MYKLRQITYLLLCLAFLAGTSTQAHAAEGEGVDVKEIVLGHMADAYEWHITTIGDSHISIPLPCIVRSEQTGDWHFFLSSTMEEEIEEGEDFHGFFFNEEKNGKIYERLADGSVVRPWDLSITKSVCQIWIVVFIMLAIFLSCARWYKKHDPKKDAPTGFVGMVEMLVMTINDDLIKDSIGEKHYRRYAPYLLTAFFFILITNMLGLLPIFPGGANVTGNINITFFLALCTMLAINLFGNKEYWKEIFWPDVPMFLKAYPLAIMPIIELFGVLTKPFALMVRLFANMMAGHAIILSFTAIIFIGWSLNAYLGSGLTLLSFVMMLFMNCLEFLVAFIQAYVFTMLSAVFIGLAHPEHHEAEG
jgi:F-type H+-transporting ATPase subunit a